MKKAKKHHQGLVFWTDILKLDQRWVATAVVWENKLIAWQKEKSRFFRKKKEIIESKLCAILETLIIAKKIAHPQILVTILSDSQKVLKVIAYPFTSKENRFLRRQMYQKTEKIQQSGHPLLFTGTQNHSGLTQNEKPNLSARNEAEKNGKLTEQWSSRASIKRNVHKIRSKNLVRWIKKQIYNREASRHGYNIPQTTEGIGLTIGSALKQYA